MKGALCSLALLSMTATAATDINSYGNTEQVKITHLGLDLTVDFDKHQLAGSATLDFKRLDPNASTLVLDTRALDISGVQQHVDGQWTSAQWSWGEKSDALGSALNIALAPKADQVKVAYHTTDGATGLQWLTPEQTAGKKHPFLFTQAQAIQARSFIPLQDSPSVRVTYDATIKVPKELMAVMSAENSQQKSADGVYRFHMPQAVPTYLIALGVGDLEFKPMSKRTGVYAEPAVLDAAAKEFEDTESMMETVEKMYGPYDWGRYDLLILPPSFPFGGMENPRLSFITPTVIAGDKSLVSLIAHELAHSWSGNLVTNATWQDLWLNEGFTTYLTYRIMEAVYGKDRERMEAVIGYKDLQEDLASIDAADTRLQPDLTGRDPDDAFSNVPYEKGALMLFEIEQKLGRKKMDDFLRNYFKTFRFQSVSTDMFLDYAAKAGLDMDRLKTWIYQPGLPTGAPKPKSDAFTKVLAAQTRWLRGQDKASALPFKDWNAQQQIYFVSELPKKLTKGQMTELDKAFGLTGTRNNEVAHVWYRQAIEHDYAPAFDAMADYLKHIGRRKLVVPLYDMLMAKPQYQEFAKKVYAQARPGYHPLAQNTLDNIVK
ncbi:M1 family metallopeptidase [Gallaecimonas xiamenensis]|uniref:Aminopeptidase N n=1 Tax=Gallaecimonas xiamenensis 3-C-1 TaxID=745411 RepID=K2JQB7_9GAMM|nr:M1 family metallopeptidase [Gallaecimonas xiamenensis]EKE77513.1 putative cold-active aminopeptidase [Gallaecimonas xiamenensis 3-C-1]